MKLNRSIFLFLSCLFLSSSNFSYALEEEKTFLPGKRPQPSSYKEGAEAFEDSDTHDDERDKAVKKMNVPSLDELDMEPNQSLNTIFNAVDKYLCDAISQKQNEYLRSLLSGLSLRGERLFNVGQVNFFFHPTEGNPMICAVQCHNHEALEILFAFQENLDSLINEDEKSDHKIIVEHLTPLHFAAKIGNWYAVNFFEEKIQAVGINPHDIKFLDPGNEYIVPTEYLKYGEVYATEEIFLTYVDFLFVYSGLEIIKHSAEVSLKNDILFESIFNQSFFFKPNLENLYYLIDLYSECEEVNKARVLALIMRHENNEIITEYILNNSDVKIDHEDTTLDGSSLLHVGTKLRSDKAVSKLLERGADADEKDKEGMTPLHLISRKFYSSSDLSLFTILLENKADVNAISNSGMTPLHYLIENFTSYEDKLMIIELLLANGAWATINKENNEGNTVLHTATKWRYCFERQKKLFNTFLPQASDSLNKKNNDGNTPLHLFLERNSDYFLSEGVIEKLVEAGADINLQNKNSESVVFKALEKVCGDRKQQEILRLVKYLFEKCKVNLEAKNIHGDTVIEVLEDLAKDGRFYTDKIADFMPENPLDTSRTEGRNFISLKNSEIQKELDTIYSTPRTKGIVTANE